MHVFSFRLALLFMIFGSVSVTVSLPTSLAVLPSDPSERFGDAAAVQQINDILSNATLHIQPLSDQLTSAIKSATPDLSGVSGIISQINTVVSATVDQLRAAPQVHSSGGNLGCALGATLQYVLNNLGYLLSLLLTGSNSSESILNNLLKSVTDLINALSQIAKFCGF